MNSPHHPIQYQTNTLNTQGIHLMNTQNTSKKHTHLMHTKPTYQRNALTSFASEARQRRQLLEGLLRGGEGHRPGGHLPAAQRGGGRFGAFFGVAFGWVLANGPFWGGCFMVFKYLNKCLHKWVLTSKRIVFGMFGVKPICSEAFRFLQVILVCCSSTGTNWGQGRPLPSRKNSSKAGFAKNKWSVFASLGRTVTQASEENTLVSQENGRVINKLPCGLKERFSHKTYSTTSKSTNLNYI